MQEQGAPIADRDTAIARLDAASALVREGAVGEALSVLGALSDPKVAGLLGVPERALLSALLLVVPEDRPRADAGEVLHAIPLSADAELAATFSL